MKRFDRRSFLKKAGLALGAAMSWSLQACGRRVREVRPTPAAPTPKPATTTVVAPTPKPVATTVVMPTSAPLAAPE
mgnify:CR=1 FL=1